MKTTLRITSALCLSALLIAASAAAKDVVVFEDDFNYANEAALDAAWPAIYSGGGNSLTLGTDSDIDPDQPYAVVGSVTIGRDLGTTITAANAPYWKLSFDVIGNSYQRVFWIALLDDTATEGYSVSWSSALATNYGEGQGFLNINKIDGAIDNWNVKPGDSQMPKLSSDIISGQQAVYASGVEMAHIDLTWEAATGTISLSINGGEETSVVDTDFSSFSKIYMKGIASYYVDNVVVAVPEPDSSGVTVAGLAALFTIAFLQRKRIINKLS